MEHPTTKQIETLVDLYGAEFRFGIEVRYRSTLPSLRKRGWVSQEYGRDGSADRWSITPQGQSVVKQFATVAHLRSPDDYDRKRTGIGAVLA